MTLKLKMPTKETLDSYHHTFYPGEGRHPKCRCEVPCAAQSRFVCMAPHHKGNRITPWCNGCDDDKPEWCDDCWAEKHQEDAA